ncbi:HNH endonuclease [Ornithinibacillus xuwenensis]|uniref:HNH endonuclease n=1 Tax=Ornithinibacillus xuwenensis TaxID=3144668 RepID=A0ABU9XL01_9BACI
MDVKYIPADWDKMRSSLGDLIGLDRYGKEMIDDLKDITENLEDAQSDIEKYDSDGVISFSHKDRENTYQSLFEDFKVLHKFTGKVGDIVERVIEEPFYEDIDSFVEAMRDATISNYTTENRIGATEEQIVYYGYGPAAQQTRKVPKAEVSLDDLLSGDNYYAEELKIQYDMWKAENPDQDFSQEEFRMAAVNMRAFEYESIKDQQYSKEFWVNIAALVVIVATTIICPPAGLSLGVAYSGLELSSAISGKDWISGRELDTGERWFRGLLAPLDIVPGVSGLKRFSSGVRFANQAVDVGQAGLKSGLKTSIQQELKHVGDMVITAGKQTETRLRNAGGAIKDATRVVKDKLARDAVEVGRAVDSVITSAKNITSPRNVMAIDEIGSVHIPAENTHFFANKISDMMGVSDDAASVGVKGTGNRVHHTEIDEVIKNDYDINGNLINRSVVPKGYDSVDDFLKVVDDTTIKEFGYDSVEEFKMVVGHVEDYLNASPKNNILNKRLAGGKHVKGVEYDVIGFPIFKGDDVKFSLKLEKDYYIMKDTDQFLKCTEKLRESINKGEVPKELFTKKQLAQIEDGLPRIDGLVWHHHQVPGKMQLVLKKVHSVNHLGGNSLWGGGIR